MRARHGMVVVWHGIKRVYWGGIQNKQNKIKYILLVRHASVQKERGRRFFFGGEKKRKPSQSEIDFIFRASFGINPKLNEQRHECALETSGFYKKGKEKKKRRE